MVLARPRPALRRALGVLAPLAILLSFAAAPHAAAQSGEMGTATIRSRSGEPIDGGGSATEFTIDLPDGAECPGDSANDDYRVGSYMLPATVDPFEVEWSGEGPDPYGLGDYESFRQPLYDDLTSGYSSKLLAENEGPGQPGQILDFPAFTFDVYEPGMVPPGRYRIGIVCNLFAEVTTVWNAEIEVEADSQDAPGQIRWTILEGVVPASSGSTSTALVIGLLVVLGVVGGGFVVVALRRRSSPQTAPQEPAR